MNLRVFLTAAATGLACAQALAAPPAAASDPWTKMPALPTACYTSQDQYFEQNEAALAAVQNDHYKQNDINSAIRQKFTDAQNADPMAMVQRMQQAMLDDPQNAQKYMEQMMQQGQAVQTELPAQMERKRQIEAEGEAVIKQYQAALAKAHGPGNARWTALKKKMGIAMDSPGPGELGVPDWAWAEWAVILREWDQGYQANCAQWWSVTGPIQGFLKRYKTFLVQERIPYETKNFDDPWLQQYQMMGVSTAGYRTTTDYEAVEDYLKMARSLFGERRLRPHCSTADRCE